MHQKASPSHFSVKSIVLLYVLLGLITALGWLAFLGSAEFAVTSVKAFPFQVLAAIAAVLSIAMLGAKVIGKARSRRGALWSAVALTIGAYLVGVILGSLVNLLISGDPFFREDVRSYFVGPLVAFCIFGTPLALAVGIALGLNLRRRMS